MFPKLYYVDASPPVRSVLLTAKALNLELELIPVDIFAGEHLKPEFEKMNPQRTVPTLDDNGYILWDSHAISAYLVGQYGKNDSLYPKDLKKRGTVDQRLHYNSSIIYPRFGAIVAPIFREGTNVIPKEKSDTIVEAYNVLEAFLQGKSYFAGDGITIADFCLVATISTSSSLIHIDEEKQPRLAAWLKSMQDLPYYDEANQVGLDKFVSFFKSKML